MKYKTEYMERLSMETVDGIFQNFLLCFQGIFHSESHLLFLPENKLDWKHISIYTFCPDAYKTVYLWPFNVQLTNNCNMRAFCI